MIHIYPNGEEHEENSTCSCSPRVIIEDESGEMIVIHSSFDGTEIPEDELQELINEEDDTELV